MGLKWIDDAAQPRLFIGAAGGVPWKTTVARRPYQMPKTTSLVRRAGVVCTISLISHRAYCYYIKYEIK